MGLDLNFQVWMNRTVIPEGCRCWAQTLNTNSAHHWYRYDVLVQQVQWSKHRLRKVEFGLNWENTRQLAEGLSLLYDRLASLPQEFWSFPSLRGEAVITRPWQKIVLSHRILEHPLELAAWLPQASPAVGKSAFLNSGLPQMAYYSQLPRRLIFFRHQWTRLPSWVVQAPAGGRLWLQGRYSFLQRCQLTDFFLTLNPSQAQVVVPPDTSVTLSLLRQWVEEKEEVPRIQEDQTLSVQDDILLSFCGGWQPQVMEDFYRAFSCACNRYYWEDRLLVLTARPQGLVTVDRISRYRVWVSIPQWLARGEIPATALFQAYRIEEVASFLGGWGGM